MNSEQLKATANELARAQKEIDDHTEEVMTRLYGSPNCFCGGGAMMITPTIRVSRPGISSLQRISIINDKPEAQS